MVASAQCWELDTQALKPGSRCILHRSTCIALVNLTSQVILAYCDNDDCCAHCIQHVMHYYTWQNMHAKSINICSLTKNNLLLLLPTIIA